MVTPKPVMTFQEYDYLFVTALNSSSSKRVLPTILKIWINHRPLALEVNHAAVFLDPSGESFPTLKKHINLKRTGFGKHR